MQAVSSIEPVSTGRPSSLERWRGAITRGNQAYECKDYDDALAHYREALMLAEGLPGHIDDAQAGVAALVVAHHNLADTYRCLQRHEQRAEHVCGAHEALYRMMADRSLDTAWKEAAFRHSRITYAEVVCFLSSWPDHVRARAAFALNAAIPMSAPPH